VNHELAQSSLLLSLQLLDSGDGVLPPQDGIFILDVVVFKQVVPLQAVNFSDGPQVLKSLCDVAENENG